MTAKIMRYQQADYINTATTGTATYALMGTGFKFESGVIPDGVQALRLERHCPQ